MIDEYIHDFMSFLTFLAYFHCLVGGEGELGSDQERLQMYVIAYVCGLFLFILFL